MIMYVNTNCYATTLPIHPMGLCNPGATLLTTRVSKRPSATGTYAIKSNVNPRYLSCAYYCQSDQRLAMR